MTSKKALEKENQELKELYAFKIQLNKNQYKIIRELSEKNLKLEDENEKLKKVIEILKSYDLKVEYVENYYTRPIIKFNHSYNEGVVGITIEEYELLKEYL